MDATGSHAITEATTLVERAKMNEEPIPPELYTPKCPVPDWAKPTETEGLPSDFIIPSDAVTSSSPQPTHRAFASAEIVELLNWVQSERDIAFQQSKECREAHDFRDGVRHAGYATAMKKVADKLRSILSPCGVEVKR